MPVDKIAITTKTSADRFTDLPARLDRLPWSGFHTLLVISLGITWLLDGLEVTMAGAVAGALKSPASLHFDNADIGLASSAYLGGAVLGALLFGWLADRLGRRKLFFVTLLLYTTATLASAFSWNLLSFVLFRFLTGAGIGGEYTAINATIQEFTPARLRGWTDLVINGTFWIGAGIGAAGSIVLLDPTLLPVNLGWRLCFGIGAILACLILFLRRHLPESPRWLMTHGRLDEAREIVVQIEHRIEGEMGKRARAAGQPDNVTLPGGPFPMLRLAATDEHRPGVHHTRLADVFHTLFYVHRQRALVGLALMAAQAFFYNAIFFTYALVLTDFYAVPAAHVGWYILPFALGNFLGPLLLGRLFDVVGRRPMIALTYSLSGILLALSGYGFSIGLFDAKTQTIAWMVIFFFASAAASAAYLTVSETFPLEVRALAIAVFYAIGTGVGGIGGPALFGWLIDSHQRAQVFTGYLLGAGLMIAAALIHLRWGVAAERKSLETVAPPLSSQRKT